MKKIVLSVLMLAVLCTALFAETDDLLLSGQPIYYGEEQFIQRISERCEGREPVGLVLTGGSARALAHIGVLKYLEEHEIVPDYIISNSMGSIIAMTYAAGMSPDQILRLVTSFDLGTLFDLSLPFGRGLLATDGLESLVASILGDDLRLENLDIPVMIVSEDLVTKRQIRICSGDFYTVFTASYALPVYFTPVKFEEHLLTDGGIANIAPLEAAYDYGKNNIIASTFYSGKSTDLRNPITVLNTAIDIGKRRQGVEEILAHPEAIWIRCDVEDFSFMEFASGSLMAERGYESSAQHEAELKRFAAFASKLSDSTVLKREAFQERIEKTEEKWMGQNHLRLHRPVSYPSLRFENSLSGLLAGYKYGVGNLEVFAGAGFSFRINSRTPLFRVKADVSLRLWPTSNSFLDVDFTYLPWKEFVASERFEYAILAKAESRVSIGESVSWSGTTKALTIRAYADTDIHLGSSGLLDVDGGFCMEGSNPGLELDLSWSSNLPSADIGYAVKAEGFYFFKPQDYSITAQARLFWRNMEFRPTFAEMVLMSDVRLGVFGQYTYAKGAVETDIIAGAFLSADTNLLGLMRIPADLMLGWDFLYDKFYFALSLGK